MENDKKQATLLLKKWQRRLRLTDWIIEIKSNAIPSDFTNQSCTGEVEYNETNKVAVIKILNPVCYGKRVTPFDFEQTLVHELLHLKFCLLDDSGNDLQDRLVHQLIEEFAKAFVEEKLK